MYFIQKVVYELRSVLKEQYFISDNAKKDESLFSLFVCLFIILKPHSILALNSNLFIILRTNKCRETGNYSYTCLQLAAIQPTHNYHREVLRYRCDYVF